MVDYLRVIVGSLLLVCSTTLIITAFSPVERRHRQALTWNHVIGISTVLVGALVALGGPFGAQVFVSAAEENLSLQQAANDASDVEVVNHASPPTSPPPSPPVAAPPTLLLPPTP